MKFTVEEMLNKYSTNPEHAKEVRRLSMMLFDNADKKLFQ